MKKYIFRPQVICTLFIIIILFIRMISISNFFEFTCFKILTIIFISIIFFMITTIFTKFIEKKSFSIKSLILIIFIMVILDSTIKAIIYSFWLPNDKFLLIPKILAIAFVKNEFQSPLFQIFSIIPSKIIGGIVKCILLLLFYIILKYLKYKGIILSDNLTKLGITMGIATAICTILDSFIYGYTIDYIYLIQLFMSFDVKDIYAVIGMGLLCSPIFSQINYKKNSL